MKTKNVNFFQKMISQISPKLKYQLEFKTRPHETLVSSVSIKLVIIHQVAALHLKWKWGQTNGLCHSG